jgi:hypothetical protein
LWEPQVRPCRSHKFLAVPNLGIILILAAAAASPSPSPAPANPCGGAHTNVLAAINRPSVGYSPCAVKPHEQLVEFGYENTTGAGGHAAQYPQGFVRFGIAPRWEFDLIGPAYGAQALHGATTSGFFDSGAGAKYEMWHDSERALAMDFLYTAPTGAHAFTAGSSVETMNLDYTMPIAGKFGFASTLGAQNGRFFSLLPSAIVTDQWSARAQAFIEAFGQTRVSPDGGSLFGMDAAVQYLLAPNLQIDAEVGRTASQGTQLHYAGFGFGVKF